MGITPCLVSRVEGGGWRVEGGGCNVVELTLAPRGYFILHGVVDLAVAGIGLAEDMMDDSGEGGRRGISYALRRR